MNTNKSAAETLATLALTDEQVDAYDYMTTCGFGDDEILAQLLAM